MRRRDVCTTCCPMAPFLVYRSKHSPTVRKHGIIFLLAQALPLRENLYSAEKTLHLQNISTSIKSVAVKISKLGPKEDRFFGKTICFNIFDQNIMTQGNVISEVVNNWQQYYAGQPQRLPGGFCEESQPWLELARHLRRHRQELATGT